LLDLELAFVGTIIINHIFIANAGSKIKFDENLIKVNWVQVFISNFALTLIWKTLA